MLVIQNSVIDPSVNTQSRPSLWTKYRSLIHARPFVGCRRLAQFHVMRQIAWSMSLKTSLLTTWR